MNTVYDYQRFAILYVDDEEKSLKYFRKAFDRTFRIFTATNAAEGYDILTQHQEEIGVIMSDQRMPGETGVQLLERARRLQPRAIRILATAYTDLDAAISAVNTGAIYKYVSKPWDLADLEITLKRCLEFFMVQLERDLLLREKLSSLHRMVIADRILSLGVLAAGLGNRMQNTFDAVRRFLDLAPEMLQREKVDLEQLRNPNFWQDFHRHVQTQVRSVLSLIENLAEQSEGPVSFDTEVRLHPAIEEAATLLREDLAAKNIKVVNAVPEDLPALRVDGKRFPRLFELLLRDELLSLESGRQVRFEARVRKDESGQPTDIELQITDDGKGLPGDVVISVLDPLVQRGGEAGDLGLHLMACYFIVYHHGGRIKVGTGPEGGTRFTLTLPLQPQPTPTGVESEEFLVRAMTNERLWERLMAGG
jgi:two-component system probable response regulator PhcQ